MKHVKALLRPSNHRDHPTMEWWYFVGFGYEDINVNPPQPTVEVDQRLSKAFIFEDNKPFLLYDAQRLIKIHHGENPQVFSVSDKRLFEARLKGE